MKVVTSTAKPTGYQPTTVTITLETLAEAKAFRAIVGNPGAVAQAVAFHGSLADKSGVTPSAVSGLCLECQGAVPFSIYQQEA